MTTTQQIPVWAAERLWPIALKYARTQPVGKRPTVRDFWNWANAADDSHRWMVEYAIDRDDQPLAEALTAARDEVLRGES